MSYSRHLCNRTRSRHHAFSWFFSFFTGAYAQVLSRPGDDFMLKWSSMLFWMRPGFYSGCGDKVIAAAKANRGGEAPFRSKLWLFVLVLKTRRPASLAILRGDGQHRILPCFWGGGIHDRLKRILPKFLYMKNSVFTNTGTRLFF